VFSGVWRSAKIKTAAHANNADCTGRRRSLLDLGLSKRSSFAAYLFIAPGSPNFCGDAPF